MGDLTNRWWAMKTKDMERALEFVAQHLAVDALNYVSMQERGGEISLLSLKPGAKQSVLYCILGDMPQEIVARVKSSPAYAHLLKAAHEVDVRISLDAAVDKDKKYLGHALFIDVSQPFGKSPDAVLYIPGFSAESPSAPAAPAA